MASSFVQAGSPLDDYFRDEVEMLADEEAIDQPGCLGSEPDDTTLVNQSSDMSFESSSSTRGWTGNIPNHASSSRSSRQSSITSQSAIPPSHQALAGDAEDTEEFAERFKYLICSSGLLEKDHVPCLGVSTKDRDNPTIVEVVVEDEAGSSGSVWADVERWRNLLSRSVDSARRRPDIALAGVVLALAVVWVTGWRVIVVFGTIAILGTGIMLRARLRTPLSVSKEAIITSVQGGPGAAKAGPRTQAMISLEELLATSKSLDHTVDSALAHLQELDDSSDPTNTFRLAVHSLTDHMTDHLATATSTLLGLVDRKELGVLGDMYDIPFATSFFYPRHKHRALNGSDQSSEDDRSSEALPPRQTAASPLKPLSLPMGTSASMPNRLNSRIRHTAHMSLSGLPPGDRYTSLPTRTPRASKRSSWAPEWNDRIKRDVQSDGGEISDSDNRLSPAPGRRPNGLVNTSGLPTTPQVPPFTPRKSSPLSQPDSPNASDGPQRHIFPIIPPTPAQQPLMPSPMVKSPIQANSKRRSLQSMPYFRSDQSDLTSPGRASVSGSTSLSRTPSLQYSDLQVLRDQSTHGSRRSSVSAANLFAPSSLPLIAALSQPLERPRPQRGNSLNPLTTPGLRAACLGVHLKRRRMACCLLGLKFSEDEEYWTTVKDVIDDLVLGIKREMADLDGALSSAKAAQFPRQARYSDPIPPPWMHMSTAASATPDFAPRTSDHALLSQHIGSMESTLHQAWTNLQKVKAGMSSSTDLSERWAAVRGDLGQLVREWERGKDVVGRLDPPQNDHVGHDHNGFDDEGRPPPLPPFMKAWDDEDDASVSRKQAAETLQTNQAGNDPTAPNHHDPPQPEIESLPPPGQDIIFESLPVHGGGATERSKLSRAERIQLMKEARDKGMTLSEMLSRREEGDQGDTRKTLELGGEVVGELKGMIGMIRRRKGLEEENGDAEPEHHHNHDSIGVTSRIAPPVGLADELKRAFVFPAQSKVNGHVSH